MKIKRQIIKMLDVAWSEGNKGKFIAVNVYIKKEERF